MININISEYEGPMDLLLRLIEKDKINIYDIPINKITDQYINYINNLETDPDNIADFVLMASTLIEIKSKMLIPSVDEDAEDPREDLVQKLLEYKKIKVLSKLLKEMEHEAALSFQKYREESPITEVISINIEEDINILSELFYNLLNKYDSEEDDFKFDKEIINRDEYTIEKYIDLIIKKMRSSKRLYLNNIIKKDSPKPEKIIIFISILELIRQNIIIATQKYKEDILLEYRELE